MKRDYEKLIQSIREEYQKCNTELRHIVESKNNEIIDISSKLRKVEEIHITLKREFDDTLKKERYTSDIFTSENEKFKKTKQDFEEERE
jgi:hypothetical protein